MDIELNYSDPKSVYFFVYLFDGVIQQQQQISFGLVEESIRRCLLSAVTHINLSDCWPAVNFEDDHRSGNNFAQINNAQVLTLLLGNFFPGIFVYV